jgi:preprotein translocase subunit SecG
MLYGIVLGVHVIVCIVLVLVVLLQSSKGGGLGGGAFGGGAESTVFGGRGAATFLSKATTVLGTAFMVTSLTLTLISTVGGGGEERPRSVVAEQAQANPFGSPVQTAPPTTPGGLEEGAQGVAPSADALSEAPQPAEGAAAGEEEPAGD